jgi:DNA-binding NtrC family response regulator
MVDSEWAPTLDTEGCVRPFDVYEAEIFRFALANAGGCVSRAAEMLRVGRATMYRKMRAYAISVPPVSERSIDRSKRNG